MYARDILDIEPWKSNKQDKTQNEWKLINPFAAPFVKPKKAFRFTELRLLFYTRLVVNFILTLLVTGGGGGGGGGGACMGCSSTQDTQQTFG